MAKLIGMALLLGVAADSFSSLPPLEIADTLKSHNVKILSLQKEIASMESQLGKTNRRYLAILKKKKKMDEAIYVQKKGLNKNLMDIEKKIQRIKGMVKLTVVNSIGEQGKVPGGILYQRIALKALRGELADLKSSKSKNQKLTQKLALLEKRYRENLETEKQLVALMQEWEYDKREKVETYIAHLKQTDKIKKRYRRLKKARRPVVRSGLFKSPVDGHIGIKHGKKGVTYKIKGRKKIMSPRQGKVIYSGKLSTYGNVVMLDHGNELRSITLGNLVPKVSKGIYVKKGETLGYTQGGVGKIYFEVRKKNKAQNTMRLLTNRSYTKKI